MNKNKGFTLIELLVVVLIIGILAAVALSQYTKAVEKSRATEAKTLLSNLVTAEQVYHMANGVFTSDLSALDIQLPGLGTTRTNTITTKNFRISVTSPIRANSTGILFGAAAMRITSTGERASGDLDYSLRVHVGGDGIVERTCYGSESTCKSIGNGRVCNGTNTEWCFSPIRDVDMATEMM